jgi:tetratricopeptide (TPR) repeat protein
VSGAGDEIRRLMAQGLDLYALGQVAEATACWRRVLSLDPAHAEARDYLSAAGGDPEPAPRAAAPPASAMTAEAVHLLRAGKPAEALDLLEAHTRKAPDDLEAQAYQEIARAALLRVYRARTGSGDRVPFVRIAPSEVMKYNLPAPAGFLLSIIDGSVSIDELLQVSGMDPFEALRALHNLLDAGIVEARPGAVEGRP